MEQLAPFGPVYQAGTLSGNPLATAAGPGGAAELDRRRYPELAARVGRFGAGLAAALGRPGVEVQVPVAGPLVGRVLRG